MFTIYSILSFFGFLLLLPFFLIQALRHGKYFGSLVERSGKLPAGLRQKEAGAIWIHAVSVGETNAVAPLVSQLRHHTGSRKIFVSTTTLTGQQNAREKILGADGFFYYPFDWRWNVRRSLAHIRPALVCLAETELWPNFIYESHRQGVKLVVVNGRISENSFRWYSRIVGFWREVLSRVDLFLMQTEEDANRICTLGAPGDRVWVCGNLKYDVNLNGGQEAVKKQIVERFAGERPGALWVAGSTAEGEEEFVLEAFRRVKAQIPGTRLILAPRRPERFNSVSALMESQNLNFIRRTQLESVHGGDFDILLLDSVGELSVLYSLAKAAFVGGSLVNKGGHNILEPAAAGVPVIFGPHMTNFAKMAQDFLDHEAALQVKDAEGLAKAAIHLLGDPEHSRLMGERGRTLIAKSSGATARTVKKILELL